MGAMKDFERRIRQGGDDAIAAVSECVAHLESELARLRHFVPPIAGTVDAESGMGFISEASLQCVAESMASYVTRAAEVPKGFEPRAMSTYGFVKPRWIPVEERLPEEGERVLAWDNGFKESEMATYYAHDGWGGEVIASLNVTHWMPLPSPPEVE